MDAESHGTDPMAGWGVAGFGGVSFIDAITNIKWYIWKIRGYYLGHECVLPVRMKSILLRS